jgi:hypothetical protein
LDGSPGKFRVRRHPTWIDTKRRWSHDFPQRVFRKGHTIAVKWQPENLNRRYTSSDLAPLLEQNPQHKTRFLAETVPAFGAIITFNKLRQNYPEYTYREVTLNPTNPEHRAT